MVDVIMNDTFATKTKPDRIEFILDDITIGDDDDITINEKDASIIDFEDLNTNYSLENYSKKQNNDKDIEAVVKMEEDWDVLTSVSLVNSTDLKRNESDWDVLSSVHSVMSMDTLHTTRSTNQMHNKPTYSAIVSKSPSNNLISLDKTKVEGNRSKNAYLGDSKKNETSTRKIKTIKEGEEEVNGLHSGDYDDREGYKFARGGKSSMMFRGNPNQKRNNGRRRASRNYRKANSRNNCY